jgi:hypothetical protein
MDLILRIALWDCSVVATVTCEGDHQLCLDFSLRVDGFRPYKIDFEGETTFLDPSYRTMILQSTGRYK